MAAKRIIPTFEEYLDKIKADIKLYYLRLVSEEALNSYLRKENEMLSEWYLHDKNEYLTDESSLEYFCKYGVAGAAHAIALMYDGPFDLA